MLAAKSFLNPETILETNRNVARRSHRDRFPDCEESAWEILFFKAIRKGVWARFAVIQAHAASRAFVGIENRHTIDDSDRVDLTGAHHGTGVANRTLRIQTEVEIQFQGAYGGRLPGFIET